MTAEILGARKCAEGKLNALVAINYAETVLQQKERQEKLIQEQCSHQNEVISKFMRNTLTNAPVRARDYVKLFKTQELVCNKYNQSFENHYISDQSRSTLTLSQDGKQLLLFNYKARGYVEDDRAGR